MFMCVTSHGNMETSDYLLSFKKRKESKTVHPRAASRMATPCIPSVFFSIVYFFLTALLLPSRNVFRFRFLAYGFDPLPT